MGQNPSKPPAKAANSPKILNLSNQTPHLTNLDHLEEQYLHYLTPTLSQLNVSHNSLESLPQSLFTLIPNLDILDLSSNKLESLPVTMVQLRKLRDLYLGMNRLLKVPDEVFCFSSTLTALEIPGNKLTSIPSKISELTNLNRLDVCSNFLEELPPEISKLTQLTFFRARGNNLKTIPKEIGQLEQLLTLDLRQNLLERIPAEVFNENGVLEKLLLSENLLSEIPDTLNNCTSLVDLDLSDNKLRTIPEIPSLWSLKRLIVSNNRLELLPELDSLDCLRELDLKGNRLKSVDSINTLPSLQFLILKENRLRSLPPHIGMNKTIEELDASFNKITEIPDEIGLITNLTRLYFCHNRIDTVPPSLGLCSKLRVLGVAMNELDDESFEPEMWEGLPNLTCVRLFGNQLTAIPTGMERCGRLDSIYLGQNQLLAANFVTSLVLKETMNDSTNESSEGSYRSSRTSIEGQPSRISTDRPSQDSIRKSKDSNASSKSGKSKDTKKNRLSTDSRASNNKDDVSLTPPRVSFEFKETQRTSRDSGRVSTEMARSRSNSRASSDTNRTNRVSKEIPPYSHLNQLSLVGNPSCSSLVDSQLCQLTSLRKLWIGECGLTALPKHIENLVFLEVLDFSDNQIAKIPKSISKLGNLQELVACHNKLTYLPADVEYCQSLKIIDISWNPGIKMIPTCVGNLRNLLHFKAMYCSITELPVPWLNLTFTPTPPQGKLSALFNLPTENTVPSLRERDGLQIKWIALEGNPIDTSILPEHIRNRIDKDLNPCKPRPRPTKPTSKSEKNSKSSISSTASTEPAPKPVNNKCFYDLSISEMQGVRPTMEDSFLVKEHSGITVGQHVFNLFAIFDGHGDAACAEFCASNFHSVLQTELAYALQPRESSKSKVAQPRRQNSGDVQASSSPKQEESERKKSKSTKKLAVEATELSDYDYFVKCVDHALANTFKHMNVVIWRREIESGCTVALTLFCGDDVWFVNCGDARVTISIGNKAVRSTIDHKATDREERIRVQKEGGYVTENGRIIGLIAVARSLGDECFQPFVSHKPSIQHSKVTDEHCFGIIACDGLWDVVDDKTAVELVAKHYQDRKTFSGAAALLRDVAYALGSGDNISTLVFGFRTLKNAIEGSNPPCRLATSTASSTPSKVSQDTKDVPLTPKSESLEKTSTEVVEKKDQVVEKKADEVNTPKKADVVEKTADKVDDQKIGVEVVEKTV